MKHVGTKNIETERLLLRKYTLDDAEYFFIEYNQYWNLEETKESLKLWIEFYNKLDVYN